MRTEKEEAKVTALMECLGERKYVAVGRIRLIEEYAARFTAKSKKWCSAHLKDIGEWMGTDTEKALDDARKTISALAECGWIELHESTNSEADEIMFRFCK